MTDKANPETVMRIAADVVIALLAHTPVAPRDLPALLAGVRRALEGAPSALQGDVSVVAIPVTDSDDGSWAPAPASPRTRSGDVQAIKPSLASVPLKPAVPIDESVHEEYLVSLEDGGRYRSLRRHLMAKYGMTPDDYRRKWGLPATYPMVAPSYARERAAVAKRIGLGRTKPVKGPTKGAAKTGRR